MRHSLSSEAKSSPFAEGLRGSFVLYLRGGAG